MHLFVYDYVFGVDWNCLGGFIGAYDKDVVFYELFMFFVFVVVGCYYVVVFGAFGLV